MIHAIKSKPCQLIANVTKMLKNINYIISNPIPDWISSSVLSQFRCTVFSEIDDFMLAVVKEAGNVLVTLPIHHGKRPSYYHTCTQAPPINQTYHSGAASFILIENTKAPNRKNIPKPG